MPPEPDALALSQSWVERVVIRLNLCPFAKAVQARGQVRYCLSAAKTEAELLHDLRSELTSLAATDPQLVDTTLLVHPHVLKDFQDYNDFLAKADAELVALELEGELQIASFHPDYCFADSEPNDPANYTNRSPFPMLHLLREASVSRAVDSFPDTSRIYERNIATLRALTPEEISGLLRDPNE
jgi:hypothetical protein